MTNLRTFSSILITGANRGIGLEFVKQYKAEATRIYACCRTPENAHELSNIAKDSGNIELLPLDVTNEQQITALHQRLSGVKLDLLINNAGVFLARGADLDKSVWLRTIEVNSLSPVFVTQALIDNLSSNDAIVANITSKMGSIADNTSGGSIIYRSSKAAMNAAIRSVAIDHANAMTSILLHPGWVKTDMGGPNALIDVETSVAGMHRVIAGTSKDMNGGFYNYDGSPIPW